MFLLISWIIFVLSHLNTNNKSICVLSLLFGFTDFITTRSRLLSKYRGKRHYHRVERFRTTSIVVKYYNTTKNLKIKTHPVRKNVAASVFFLKRQHCVDAASRPGLICFCGEDVVSAGRLCWWVDWCWCRGFVGWWSLFLWAFGRKCLVLCRKAPLMWGV